MKNYFKAAGHLFFFHDAVPESVESAFRAAVFVAENPAIFRPSQFAGPWDACPVIGHRPRADILRDLSTETDEEELLRLSDELVALETCFEDVGRKAPLMAVAA